MAEIRKQAALNVETMTNTLVRQYVDNTRNVYFVDENKYSMYMMNLASTIMLFRPEEVEKVRFRHILHCLRVGVGADTDPNR